VYPTSRASPRLFRDPDNELNPTDVAVVPIVFSQQEQWKAVALNGKAARAATAEVVAQRHRASVCQIGGRE
jgi:hypothetical protein